jgi:nucleotide-binding universal stress UspA family protein
MRTTGLGKLIKPAGYVAAHRSAGDLLKPVREDYPEVKASTYVMCGNTVPILVGAALEACPVVVGAHRHLGPLSMGAGYVVQGLLAHSPTPVAVVPVT